MLRTGYIVSRQADTVWFLLLPFAAFAMAMASQQWLTAVAITSVLLLINGPHNFVTLFRTCGLPEDRQRFGDRLIVGAIVCFAIVAIGLTRAPLTLALLLVMWNHQHNLMQIHGFSRIYDFKARTGSLTTGRWDLALNWIVYGNMFLTSPLYTQFWLRELYRFQVPLAVEGVHRVHVACWSITAAFVAAYVLHLVSSVRKGDRLNPIKYMFIMSTYLVIYGTAWMTTSVLVHAIATVIIHGVQYMVIVYYYMQRKVEQTGQTNCWVARFVRPGNAMLFILICFLYTVFIQLIGMKPFDEFGFGLIVSMTSMYEPIPTHGISGMSVMGSTELILLVLINAPGMLHLYYDSFIWKVRDTNIHGGL